MPARRNRGVTLIEIMMVVAMGSIIITTADAVVAAAMRLKQNGERNLEVQLGSSIAAIAIQADLMNAGYRFASAAYAVRRFNNIDTTIALSGTPGPVTANGNCGPPNGQLVPGTDVIEMAEGAQDTALASSTAGDGVLTVSSNGAQYDIALVTGAPFNPNETNLASRLGQILLFVDGTALSCMGRVTASNTGTTATIEMLDRDFNVNPSHQADYIGGNACPRVGMSVYRLGQRVRYMVCVVPGPPPPATPNQPGLYRQVAGGDGVFGQPQLLQEGIEDLQIAMRQWNPAGPGQHSGPGCVAAPNNQGYCYCNEAPANACDQADPTTFINAASFPTKMRGARVMVTSISRRKAHAEPLPDDLRPPAFDRPGATGPPDGFARAQQTFSIGFNNITMVSP